MMIEVGFWRRLYRIIRANVNHYRYRPRKPKKVKSIPIKVKSKPEPYILSPYQAERLAIRKAERVKLRSNMPIPASLDDAMRNDIRTYQRAATLASMSRDDPHNYYHRER